MAPSEYEAEPRLKKTRTPFDGRQLIDGLGLLVSFTGLVISGWALFFSGSLTLTILAVFICLIAGASLALAFFLSRAINRIEREGSRERRWAIAMPKMNQALAHLAESVSTFDSANDVGGKRDFQTHAMLACQAMSAAFTQVVGKDCRVTLKEAFAPPTGATDARGMDPSGDMAVKDLCSTGGTAGAVFGRSIDWVSGNTDFSEILSGRANFFFSNDLPSEIADGYVNSHWTREKVKEMRRDASFPYQATIVWPVRALIEKTPDETVWNIVGYLCVDCTETDAFDAKIDVLYGQVLAQAFYPVWPRTRLDVAEIPEMERVTQ